MCRLRRVIRFGFSRGFSGPVHDWEISTPEDRKGMGEGMVGLVGRE